MNDIGKLKILGSAYRPEYYLWVDKYGDARKSDRAPISDNDGRILGLEELGRLMKEYLLKSGKEE